MPCCRTGWYPIYPSSVKLIANGHIMAVVAGTARALSVCEPGAEQVAFVGTFNGHQLSLAAADAVLDILADGTVVAALEERTRRLARTCRELAAKYGVDVQFKGGGGRFQWYFNPRPVRNYREAWASDPHAYAIFREAMLEAGVVVAGNYLGHNAISLAHGEKELEFLERAMASALPPWQGAPAHAADKAARRHPAADAGRPSVVLDPGQRRTGHGRRSRRPHRVSEGTPRDRLSLTPRSAPRG